MNRIFYILMAMLLVFAACDDFFDEELEGKTVELVGPVDNLETSGTSFTFWWNTVDGATKYNLQIVSPTFEQMEELVLDTNLIETQYEYQLYPGIFQWRVKAMNGSSETEYTTYSLTVDSTLDLSTSTVILNNPEDNYATSETSLEFSWETISLADDYELRLMLGDWETGSLKAKEETTENSITIDITSEGTYIWGVRASNIYSVSKYGTNTLIVDRTDPQRPTLDSPAQGEETSTNVTFSWTRPDESGSTITDSLYVSTDSTFVANHEVAIKRTETSYSKTFNVTSSQKYYWRVRSIDAAGNKSDYSVTRRFTVIK
ncbi:MAG: hypothetical protein KQH79_12885 [Bacteroidetes bacterium]|nr:hypothetical protein [Bacteroidota bacterium]